MTTKLFCGNLSFSTTEADLEAHVKTIKPAGFVGLSISRRGEKSKGWGILEFDNNANAVAAIPKLHDTTVDGRPLRVREDQPEKPKAAPAAAQVPASRPPRANNNNNSASVGAVDVPSTPTNRLYVGNLPWEVTSEELLKLFAPFRATTADVAKRLSGRSKGFGTVEFPTVENATEALNKMAEHKMGERTLSIRYDRMAIPSEPCDRLFVGNIPWSADDEALAAMFSGFKVQSASVKAVNGRSRGFGVVKFSSKEEASNALKALSEFEYEGRKVFTRFDRDL